VIGTNLFAGTYRGAFLSTNNGAGWTGAGMTDTHVNALTASGANLFAGTLNGVFLSTNNGTSWRAVNLGLTETGVNAIAASGTNFFAGTYGGIFVSTNDGTSWIPVSDGLGIHEVLALAVSGTNLFAGAGIVWRRPISEMQSMQYPLSIQPVAGDSLWFGNIVMGKDSLRVVTLLDSGQVPITIRAFILADNQFDFATSDLSGAVTLQPGERFTFEILFKPSTTGYHRATLSLLGETGFKVITLSGISSDAATVKSHSEHYISLAIYPNPTSSSTTITFTPEASGYAEISIVNLLGVEVARVFSGVLDASEHRFTWDAAKMAAPRGMYECIVRMNGRTQALPIVME
jgi:hypothetical protein